MSENEIEQIIKNASCSTEMEGYFIDKTAKEWCRKLIRKEITIDEYISFVKTRAGVGL